MIVNIAEAWQRYAVARDLAANKLDSETLRELVDARNELDRLTLEDCRGIYKAAHRHVEARSRARAAKNRT